LVAGAALASIVMASRNLQHRRRDIHVAASAGAASADSASLSTALDKIPYAAAIALGATAAVLQPAWLRAAIEGALS
jgi:Flp pilus assembly protein protease CpaA